jgi:chemotaxis protein methyltransferase CheR
MDTIDYVPEVITITDEEFRLISRLVYDKFGITLTDQKKSLVVGRLQKELKSRRLSSFKEYYESVIHDSDGAELNTLINSISTNHTYFNREFAHFNFFTTQALPELVQHANNKDSRTIRVWSAGCSTGEEPYTLAIILNEFTRQERKPHEFAILATDISEKALEHARKGVYQSENVERLPINLRDKYFKKSDQATSEVKAEIKKQVLFRRLNLMRPVFPFKNKFNVIFCRNVMIYFDIPTREGLLRRFHQNLETGGYLFLGHSESIGRNNSNFSYIKPAVYQKIE